MVTFVPVTYEWSALESNPDKLFGKCSITGYVKFMYSDLISMEDKNLVAD
jgi:hypothetical protein